MNIVFLFVPISLLALLLLWYAARSQRRRLAWGDEIAARTEPVDIASFRNLVDPDEELFLRAHLSAGEFRALHRERLRAALDYVRRISHNSVVLLRLGEAARLHPDPEVADGARRLIEEAIRLRVLSMLAMAKLGVGILLPGIPISGIALVGRYQQLSGLGVRVARMQGPAKAAHAPGLS